MTGPSGALPPAPPPPAVPPGYRMVPGSRHPQYRPAGDGRIAVPSWVLVAAFVFVLVAVTVIAAAAVIVLTRPPSPPDCPPGQPCGGPPVTGSGPNASPSPSGPIGSSAPGPISSAAPLITGKVQANDELGYSIAYDEDWWTPEDAAARDLRLTIVWAKYGDPALWIHAAPATEMTPEQLMTELRDQLAGKVVGLATDSRPQNTIQDPEIGYQRGIGGTWAGSADSPQGAGKPVLIFMEAATDGRLSVAAALVLEGDFTLDYSASGYARTFRTETDKVLNSFTWPAP